jgi:hypothetical protein
MLVGMTGGEEARKCDWISNFVTTQQRESKLFSAFTAPKFD